MECARELDWVAKLKLLEQYRDRDGLDWDDAKLHLIDLQYADVRPEKGLYHRLVGWGRSSGCSTTTSIEPAMHEPPEDTRAYFRGRCLEKYADQRRRRLLGLGDLRPARAASRCSGCPPSTRCGAAGPTSASCIDRCDTAEQLFAALTR